MTPTNGDFTHLGPGITLLKMLETDQNACQPGDAKEIAERQQRVTPEVEVRKATLTQCDQDLAQSGETLAEVAQTAKERIATMNAETIKGFRERISVGVACNAFDYAQKINALQAEVNFLTGTADLLRWRIIPGQTLRKLEADLEIGRAHV